MTDMFDLDRRTMLGSIAALLGTAALPAEAIAARRRRGTQRFLSAPRFTLLSALADTILPATDTPGAIAAQVPAKLDGLLTNWASPDTRTMITGALDRIDAAARAQKGKAFAALSVADRVAVLRPHDEAALKKVPPPANAVSANPFAPAVYVADPGYHKIKDLVMSLYYYSEIATSTELIYEHVPGKFEPSIKLTPASRPHLGTGPF